MSAKNPRINVTVKPDMADLLNFLAKKEHKSTSSFAKDLIEEALEMREDMALYEIAKEADKPGMELISHEEAWK